MTKPTWLSAKPGGFLAFTVRLCEKPKHRTREQWQPDSIQDLYMQRPVLASPFSCQTLLISNNAAGQGSTVITFPHYLRQGINTHSALLVACLHACGVLEPDFPRGLHYRRYGIFGI